MITQRTRRREDDAFYDRWAALMQSALVIGEDHPIVQQILSYKRPAAEPTQKAHGTGADAQIQ